MRSITWGWPSPPATRRSSDCSAARTRSERPRRRRRDPRRPSSHDGPRLLRGHRLHWSRLSRELSALHGARPHQLPAAPWCRSARDVRRNREGGAGLRLCGALDADRIPQTGAYGRPARHRDRAAGSERRLGHAAAARHARRGGPDRGCGPGRVRVRWTRAADPGAAARRDARRSAVIARAAGYRRLAAPDVNTLNMSWNNRQGGGRGQRSYHHGNLKEALLRAALELIAKKGPAGFTFAEAARWAGVSPAAPYRHFRDRDELLANVALRGFQQFEAALTRAWDEGRPNPFVAFDRLGKAYLAFARSEPAYYSAMFEAGIPLDT